VRKRRIVSSAMMTEEGQGELGQVCRPERSKPRPGRTLRLRELLVRFGDAAGFGQTTVICELTAVSCAELSTGPKAL